jgi:hypothetical protein
MGAIICLVVVLPDHTAFPAVETACVFLGYSNETPSKRDTSSRGGIPMPGDHLNESGAGLAHRRFPRTTLAGGANERTSGASEGLSPPF